MFIVTYTGVVGLDRGWNLFTVFFGEMAKMTWSGRFNSEFICFLTLSGLWTAWRNNFTLLGVFLGVIGFFGGIMFLAPYLFIESYRANGDYKKLLLGETRTNS